MRAIFTAYRLIPNGWKPRFWAVSGYATVVALLETVGVASVMPFVALLADPAAIQRSLDKSLIGQMLPADIASWPVHWLGGGIIALFIVTNLLGFLSLWGSVRFAARLGVKLSRELTERYLNQGYLFLRTMGTAAAANDVTRETEKLVVGAVLQLCLLASKSIQVVFVVALLALVSPKFTAVFCLVATLLYTGLFRIFRKRAAQAGQQVMSASAEVAQQANELFVSARDVLARRKGTFFVDRLAAVSTQFYKAEAFARVAPSVPKYVIEATAFTALMAVPVIRSFRGEDYQSLLPVIALFAYAGYRILPALQQAYSSLSVLKYYQALAERISTSLAAPAAGELSTTVPPDGFDSEIAFVDASYQYPGAAAPTLASFSLCIRKGEKLAVVGPSGAGKSTFLDILLGLISIGAGSLRVDAHSVGSCFVWRDSVGFVPQSPIVMTGTVAENIAFGVPESGINVTRCKTVAKTAAIDQTIEALPDGYRTRLGGGISLSGGETQRLAIARALYHCPALLVMDEPSSALDPGIAEQIMARLCGHDSATTLVVVTHDWDLLRFFDRVVVLDAGRVVADGTFSELEDRLALLREQCFVARP